MKIRITYIPYNPSLKSALVAVIIIAVLILLNSCEHVTALVSASIPTFSHSIFNNPRTSIIRSATTNDNREKIGIDPVSSFGQKPSKAKDVKSLLDEFRCHNEIINPYRVLKVSRTASKSEIREAYRSLAKKYHPDGARFRKILPGKCNNVEEIRDEWERINFSYEILRDSKMRARYERNSALDNPAGALGRAALNTVGWSLTSMGRLLLKVGEFALDRVVSANRSSPSVMNENTKNK